MKQRDFEIFMNTIQRQSDNAMLELKAFLYCAAAMVIAGCVFFACTTTDKSAAVSVQAANTAADGYYEWYALKTNQTPAKASALLPGFQKVMGAQQSFGLVNANYKAISAMYKTNAALKGSVESALIAVNQNKSNLLWLVNYFKQ